MAEYGSENTRGDRGRSLRNGMIFGANIVVNVLGRAVVSYLTLFRIADDSCKKISLPRLCSVTFLGEDGMRFNSRSTTFSI